MERCVHDLVAVECTEGIPALKQAITKLLSDAPRSGRRPSTTSEQLTQVASLSRENPSDSGLPISHWTSLELANDVHSDGRSGRFYKYREI